MFIYRTSAGEFTISRTSDVGYELQLDGEGLGKYESQQDAANALAEGVVFQPRWRQVDFEQLDVPRDLSLWEYFFS